MTYSLFADLTPPTSGNAETLGVSLAEEFVCQPGWLVGYRFVRPSTDTPGPFSAAFYDTATGTADPATVVNGINPGAAVGWIDVLLPTPVRFTSVIRARPTIYHPSGKYAYLNGAFGPSGPWASGRTNGGLYAPPNSATAQGNGLYVAGASNAYPVNSYDSTFYYVDLLWSDTDPSTRTGTGSTAVTLTTSGTGIARRAGGGTATVALTTTGSGTARRAGTATTGITLTTSGAGTTRRSGTAAVDVALTVTGAGTSRRSGTATVDITVDVMGAGRVPGQFLGRLSSGEPRTTWSSGPPIT